MHWGFRMPQVSKRTGQPIQPRAINNARDDKLLDSRFWRGSFEERRCLVPATSFCEAKGRAPATYYWFALQGEEPRPAFAFAGLWRSFRGNYRDELVEIDTHTVITTTPNELVRPIHPDRMPVTRIAPGPDEDFRVSIHAPAKGATSRLKSSSDRLPFRSTPPRRGRHPAALALVNVDQFRSTPPRRGRPGRRRCA